MAATILFLKNVKLNTMFKRIGFINVKEMVATNLFVKN